jgi:hypothetical protein
MPGIGMRGELAMAAQGTTLNFDATGSLCLLDQKERETRLTRPLNSLYTTGRSVVKISPIITRGLPENGDLAKGFPFRTHSRGGGPVVVEGC